MARREPNSRSLDDQLVGYLLDALENEEQQEVQASLETSPETRHKVNLLRQLLRPLECDREDPLPPLSLVERTLARLAEQPSLPRAPHLSRNSATSGSWWRRTDVLVASVLLLLCLGITLGWVGFVRQRADLTVCQDNLRRLHRSLLQYSEQRPDGAFPQVSESGPFAFAGVFIPQLADAGVLTDNTHLSCPGSEDPPPPLSPEHLAQLKEWYQADRDRYNRAVASHAGAYAYSLGYRELGGLRGFRRAEGMDQVPILADRPPFKGTLLGGEGNSREHNGTGQNVLYISGAVRFVTARMLDNDDIYLNDLQMVLAGVRESDYVIASSDAFP